MWGVLTRMLPPSVQPTASLRSSSQSIHTMFGLMLNFSLPIAGRLQKDDTGRGGIPQPNASVTWTYQTEWDIVTILCKS